MSEATPAPGEGKGLRAMARNRRNKTWEIETQDDDDRFASLTVKDAGGSELRYRVRRQPFGFHPGGTSPGR